jgi:hypothetical protein
MAAMIRTMGSSRSFLIEGQDIKRLAQAVRAAVRAAERSRAFTMIGGFGYRECPPT